MKRKRILVVEDSMTGREVMCDLLTDLGHVPEAVRSAEEALEAPAIWSRYDAFVLDLNLPGMSGVELLGVLKAKDPQAIVVLVTAFDHSPLAGSLGGYENVWFFPKPANVYTLGTVLKNAFDAQELRRDVDRLRNVSLGIKSVGKVRDLDQEFRVLLHLAADSLQADAGLVAMYEPEDERLRLRSAVGLSTERPPEVVPAGGILGRCDARGEPVVSDGVRAARMPDLKVLFPGVPRLHVLGIPLLSRQRLVGVLGLFRDPERGGFGEKEVALAKVYAATAAVALENLTLLDDARRAYERQLEAQRELIQSRKLSSLGQVTAGISHEIKNPLTVILGNLGLIRIKVDGAGVGPYLDRIEDQCRRIHKLINDLKSVYHPGESDRRRFRIRALLDEARAVAPPPKGEGGVDLEIDLGRDDPVVHGDFAQLLQVLVNLLSNSYQAMAPDGGAVRIRYRLDGEDHVLEFEDEGPGIPEELGRRVFEPFFTTKGAAGTGLGLWISQTILRSHGGAMELGEAPGGGARFLLRLPSEVSEGLVEFGTSIPASHAAPSRSGPLARILVLDDEEGIRDYLVELLDSEGYETVSVATPEAAERELEDGRFDLLVLDELLQGASGREFHARVVRPRYHLPTVLFTGSEGIRAEELARNGIHAVVRKPASGLRLLEAIQEALLATVRVDEVS